MGKWVASTGDSIVVSIKGCSLAACETSTTPESVPLVCTSSAGATITSSVPTGDRLGSTDVSIKGSIAAAEKDDVSTFLSNMWAVKGSTVAVLSSADSGAASTLVSIVISTAAASDPDPAGVVLVVRTVSLETLSAADS